MYVCKRRGTKKRGEISEAAEEKREAPRKDKSIERCKKTGGRIEVNLNER